MRTEITSDQRKIGHSPPPLSSLESFQIFQNLYFWRRTADSDMRSSLHIKESDLFTKLHHFMAILHLKIDERLSVRWTLICFPSIFWNWRSLAQRALFLEFADKQVFLLYLLLCWDFRVKGGEITVDYSFLQVKIVDCWWISSYIRFHELWLQSRRVPVWGSVGRANRHQLWWQLISK